MFKMILRNMRAPCAERTRGHRTVLGAGNGARARANGAGAELVDRRFGFVDKQVSAKETEDKLKRQNQTRGSPRGPIFRILRASGPSTGYEAHSPRPALIP